MAIQNISSAQIPVNPFSSESQPVKSPASYPCLITIVKEQKGRVTLHECRCGSVWCIRCCRYRLRKTAEILFSMDWRRVREVMLSVDRNQFKDGQEAFEFLTDSKRVRDLIKNLKRTAKCKILKVLKFLEWHRDGFPHWHLIIEVEDYGKAGMIGEESLHRYWPWGRITEGYIKDEYHWKNMVGYFRDHGYWGKNKGHQVVLPLWARDYDKRIRRWSGLGGKNTSSVERLAVKNTKKRHVRAMRPYHLILDECGVNTRVEISWELGNVEGASWYTVHCQIKEVITEKFEWVKGEGWVLDMSQEDFEQWLKGHKNLKHIWFDYQPLLYEVYWPEEQHKQGFSLGEDYSKKYEDEIPF